MKKVMLLALCMGLFLGTGAYAQKGDPTNLCQKKIKDPADVEKKFRLFRRQKSERKLERQDSKRRFYYAVGDGVSSRQSSSIVKARLAGTKALAVAIASVFEGAEANLFVENTENEKENKGDVLVDFAGSISKMNFRNLLKTCERTIEENGKYHSYYGLRINIADAEEAIIDLAKNKEEELGVRFNIENMTQYLSFMADEQ